MSGSRLKQAGEDYARAWQSGNLAARKMTPVFANFIRLIRAQQSKAKCTARPGLSLLLSLP
jgi:hypothetical protein